MADQKLFVGPRIRRVRQELELTKERLAEARRESDRWKRLLEICVRDAA